jgi:hypothetical protein
VDYRQSEFQRRLYAAYTQDKVIDILELAERLCKRPDTIYAYAAGELRLHADDAARISRFILETRPEYTKLGELFVPKTHAIIPVGSPGMVESLVAIARSVNELVAKVRAK